MIARSSPALITIIRESMPLIFPATVLTERLLLRPWRVADAAALKAALDANLEHLRVWLAWAMDEPSPLDVIEARIRKFEDDFAAGTDGLYGIFTRDESTVLGGTGLHPRIADGVEIGYWIAKTHTGQGYATEAARALTAAALLLPGVQHVQIRCNQRNSASAAVPRRLGFQLIDTLVRDALTPNGEPRRTMVWQQSRGDSARIPYTRSQ